MIPTEFPAANSISQTDADVQGNLLRENEQKFAELPEQQNLTKLCSDDGFSMNTDKGQFFITLGEEGPEKKKHHVESTLYLEVKKHPAREGGFVETRRSAQSWM